MASKIYQIADALEMQESIRDARIDIHLRLGECLCKFNAHEECGYCSNEFDC